MANNGNHITAPVNTDDVSSVLGVNSHDIATLCRSDKINPYSLIRPGYTTYPSFGPESFENYPEMGTIPSSGSSGWYYKRAKWGYYVPCVGNPAYIKNVYLQPWVFNAPSGDSFDCLTHFDGYRHNARPKLPVEPRIIPEKEILVSISPPSPQKEILSSTGKGNNGGVVALYEVLGSVRLGFTLFQGTSIKGAYLYPTPIGTSDLQEIVLIKTATIALSNREYTVIPWATDGNIVNGEIVAGSNFFGLKFSKDFEGFITIHTDTVYVYIGNVDLSKTTTRLSFTVPLVNTNSTAQSVYGFKLTVKYTDMTATAGSREKVVELTGSANISVPANGTIEISLYTTDSEIVMASNENRIRYMYITATWAAPSGSKVIESPAIGLTPVTPPYVDLT